MVFRDRELEEWILTGLGSEIYSVVSVDLIIDEAPKYLVNKIPSAQALSELLFTLYAEGLLTYTGLKFYLTAEGKLHYRKFLEPIQIIAKNEEFYSTIIDSVEGDSKTKKDFKKLLKKIKNKSADETDSEFRKFGYDLGKDAIWFTVRLIIETLAKTG